MTGDRLDDEDDGDRPPDQVLEGVGPVGEAGGDRAEAPHGARAEGEQRGDERDVLLVAVPCAGLVAVIARRRRISAEMAGHDLVEVADHGVAGLGHHVRLRVGVDGDDVLGRHRPDPVLDGPGDAAGDVHGRGDPRAGLADLVGVVAPAVVGDGAGAPDDAAEQPGQLLERREAIGRADTAAAADDDRCGGERDPGLALDTIDDGAAGERRVELDGAGARRPASAASSTAVASTAWTATVSSRTGASRAVSSSSEPPQRTRVSGPSAEIVVQLATIGRSRRAAAWASTSLPRSVPGASTMSGASAVTAWATAAPHVSGP